jgi:hypothetical protein
VDRHVDLARRAFDLDAAHRGIGQLATHELAHLEVGVDLVGELLLAGIPGGHELARYAEADADWIDLLAHRYSFLPSLT